MTIVRTIPFARPWITDADRQAVDEVLRVDILTHGPQNRAFEEEFADFAGGGHAVAVSSCMAALHLAYLQLGIGPGDEVIVPAQTHVATAHAAELVGAHAVFADCDPRTGNLDPGQVEELVTARTKAIGLVHFLGIPCPMKEILAVADRHGLKVIEDCALALGARYDGTHVGLLGDAGCFSFYPVKHITTGDGGMFLTRHHDLAEKVRKARSFGVDRTFAERTIPGMYDVPSLGMNYRMSDINAALGRCQLARVGENLARRRRHFKILVAALANLEHVRVIDARETVTASTHYCLSAVLEDPLKGQRNELVKRLNEAGVGTSVYYPQPVPRMAYYRNKYGYDAGRYRQAAILSDQSVALPVGPHLSAEDVAYVGQTFAGTIEEMSV
jgi:dTDP-4-amino-4,6-dideoxygalactose transaminase